MTVAKLASSSVFVACLVIGGAANAAEPSRADSLFREGRTLLDARRYDEACPKLAESQKVEPGAGTLLALALCHEGQGKLATAHDELLAAAELGRRVGRKELAQAAEKRARAMEANVPKLVVRLPEEGTSDYVVRLDGEPLDRAAMSKPMSVDAGEHSVEVSAKGRVSRTYPIRLTNAKQLELSIDKLESERIVVAPAPPTPRSNTSALQFSEAPGPEADTNRGGTQRAIGLVVGGVGLATILAGGGYFTVKAISARQDARDSDDGAGNKESRENAGLALISASAGIGMIAAGAVLYFTAPRGTTRSAYVVPAAGPNQAGLNVVGSF